MCAIISILFRHRIALEVAGKNAGSLGLEKIGATVEDSGSANDIAAVRTPIVSS